MCYDTVQRRPGGSAGPWTAGAGRRPPGPAVKITHRRRQHGMQKILIVEDDADIAAIERDYL